MSPVVHHTASEHAAVAVPQHASPRILAIDYGRRKIGLAVSDPLAMIAQPLATLERTNRRDDLRRLRQICAAHQVARILVGHPLRLSGEAGEMAREAAQFAARVKKALGIEVELVDERLTSWEAAHTVTAPGAKPRKSQKSPARARRQSRRPIDHLAAAVLLREYLDRTRAASASASASTFASTSVERA